MATLYNVYDATSTSNDWTTTSAQQEYYTITEDLIRQYTSHYAPDKKICVVDNFDWSYLKGKEPVDEIKEGFDEIIEEVENM